MGGGGGGAGFSRTVANPIVAKMITAKQPATMTTDTYFASEKLNARNRSAQPSWSLVLPDAGSWRRPGKNCDGDALDGAGRCGRPDVPASSAICSSAAASTTLEG